MQQPIRIISKANRRLYADAIPGHFATNHSHINYYIDMSELKHNLSLALEAARSIAFHFSVVSVDTILCLEGTEYIGAFVARELSNVGLGGMNSGKDIYLIEPDNNVNGQFMFADNLRHMIDNLNVLILVNTASTGQTLSQARECLNPASLKLPKVVQTKTKGRRTSPMCSTQPWRVLSSCFSSHTMALPG